MFELEWGGLEQTCKPLEKKCTNFSSPLMMNNMGPGNNYICPVRLGKPWTQQRQIDLSTGICPVNYQPCSALTSFANTICVPKNMDLSLCPVTWIRFLPKNSFKNDTISRFNFNQEFDFAWSRHYDSLPIGPTKISASTPCLKHAEKPNLIYTMHPSELDRTNKCTSLDFRYKKTGKFEISLYDLQENNGVLRQLEGKIELE